MKFDKNELAKKIRESENLSNDDKSCLLELLNEKKTYGLVWEDSTEDAYEELKTKIPVLREVEDKQILKEKDDEHFPSHILIEGENLLALVALAYSHAGMIDVIYIDPPYNTGNKDFVYNDTFIGDDDAYRHSKWLSFMEKRLRAAKTLLSDKGVIFISIDDNEQANLKLLCDEIFGTHNFAANIIWEKADSPRMDAKDFSSRHDFILCYYKDKETLPIKKLKMGEAPEHYNKIESDGRRYYLKPLRYMGNADAREDRPNLYFPLTAPDGSLVYPIRADGSDGRWRWSKEKVASEINRIEWVKTKKGWSAYSKIYANEDSEIPVETIWFNKDVESNRQAIATIKNIFGNDKVFTNPKPVKLIQRILEISTDNNSVILDFFAGSGTTMQATMQINAEDGGNRQCILVTNNENNICEEVTYERNKRVIEGYTTPKGEKVAGLIKNNLRYYKVEMVEREQNHQKNKELVYGLKDLLCIKDNLYNESSQFGTLSLRGKEKMIRCFTDNEQQMLMVYDSRVIPYLIKEIEVMEQKVKIYLFADGAYPYTQDFQSVLDKVDLIPLPYAYHRSIKDVLPDDAPIKVDDTELSSEEQKEMMAEAIEAENKENMEG